MPLPGRLRPSASVRQFIELAVNIPEQEPQVGQAERSYSATCSSLALSSTAIVTQLLVEKGEFSSRTGRTAFAVLLFQDIAVVPLLVLVNSFAGDGGSVLAALGLSLVKAAVAFALILGLGRLTLRPIFRLVARGRSPEMLMALTLLIPS